MYTMKLKNGKGEILETRKVGTWRDHAVEKFASVRNLLTRKTTTRFTLELVDELTGETVAEHTA
ncbi:MAG: hypothetical protein ACR2QW_18350 [bacterium]